jgi:RNA polymerase sigma-70 factor (ECF subfamily)
MSLLDELRVLLPGGDEEALRGVAEVLAARLSAARARWPGVAIDDAALVAQLWPAGAPKERKAPLDAEALGALHLEDVFLACACLSGDRIALAELEKSVLAQVPRWLARFEGVAADDVQQELRHKLLLGPPPHLLDFTGRGALVRWVRVAAARCAIDLQRRIKPVDEGDAVEQLFAGPDPELDFVKLHDREALRAVLREALGGLPARELALLRLHYLEGLSLEKLAAIERVHRATVARWLSGARATALGQVRALLRARLRLSAQEGDSLLRLLGSRLELSLRGALA